MDKYTRLNFDKYVMSNRVCDLIACKLLNQQSALIHFDAAEMSPNRVTSIKKHVRCPGNRKMLRSFRKRPDCFVNMVDEYYSSQTCAKCFGRFDPRTKSHRFKICVDCKPNPRARQPNIIVAKKGKRLMSLMRFLIECGGAEQPNRPK